MLQLLVGTNYSFMKYRRIAYVIATLMVIATAVWLIVNGGPRYGVDFTGGSATQILTRPVLPPDQVRAALESAGIGGAEVQTISGDRGDEYLIRSQVSVESDPFPQIEQAIESRHPGVEVELRSAERVSAKVGAELREKAIWAILTSLGAILLYVGLRYEFKFALGAVVALFHDVFVTLGVLCFTNREISLTVLAALLTIAGFSINDKIVTFDRIRERQKSLRKETHSRVMDIAVNETLSRTVITNITVLLSAVALLIWGGAVLHDFSFSIVTGMLLGTFSSIFLASALALDLWIRLDRRKGIHAE